MTLRDYTIALLASIRRQAELAECAAILRKIGGRS
jgi:hypothetical protein